jgi:hypothetical protein
LPCRFEGLVLDRAQLALRDPGRSRDRASRYAGGHPALVVLKLHLESTDFRWFPMLLLCHSFGRFISNPSWNLSALPRPWNHLSDSVNPSWFWREPWPSLAVWLPGVIPVQPFDFLWSLHITGIIMANWATERLQQFELKRWKKVLKKKVKKCGSKMQNIEQIEALFSFPLH